DNADVLNDMVQKAGAHSTDVADPEPAEEYCRKCDDKAAAWKPVADRLWTESEKERAGARADNDRIAAEEIAAAAARRNKEKVIPEVHWNIR
ncbi:MAG TPA: hypothetical protein DCL73_04685, partial [Treponema sp.]|nr:hypothetical protein [Treponema sp.]